MGALQHDRFRLGVFLPAAAAFQVHGAELPLLERVVDAAQEAHVLLVVGDGEPVLDDLDARAHEHLLELGHGAEELLVLVVAAKAHHALDAGAVVPAAVEQHHLAGGRQVRHVALEVPLRAFAVVGRGQRGHAGHARVQALGDALDDTALARRVAAFEKDDHLLLAVLHPVLQLDQLALQAKEFLEVGLARRLVGHGRRGRAGVEPVEVAVFDLQFEFFVVAVDQVAGDALHQVFVVGKCARQHDEKGQEWRVDKKHAAPAT
ncbi:hypothetical protein D3C72_1449330 [compost metagenome]